MPTVTTCLRQGLATALAALALACSNGDNGPTGGNNFSIQISVNPQQLTVQQGGTGTVTITLVRGGGFSATVTATVTGLPAGVTVSVNPSQLTGATTSAVVTVDVAGSVAPGTYTATITASASGVGSATTTYQLIVTEAPNYTLAVSPAQVTIVQGQMSDLNVTITRTNFQGAVNLSLQNPPAGVAGAFNPASPTGNASVLTLVVGNAVVPGNYTITVLGTATGVPNVAEADAADPPMPAAGDRTATFQLTVDPSAGIALEATPTPVQALQGGIATSTVSIARDNFAGAVDLAASGMPNGMTVTLDQASTVGNTSTATVIVAPAVPVGVYPVTITGSGTGILNATTTLTVEVSAPPAIFNTEYQFPGPLNPVYFAAQDGVGAWTPVLPLFNPATGVYTYRSQITAGFGGVYYVFDFTEAAASSQAALAAGLPLAADLMAMVPRRGGPMLTEGPMGMVAVQSYGTPSELSGLAQLKDFSPRVDVLANVLNGTPSTDVWVDGRVAEYDGTTNPVVIAGVRPDGLNDGVVASRWHPDGFVDRVYRNPSAGTTNMVDMLGANSAPPAVAFLGIPNATGPTGYVSHLWAGGRFVGGIHGQEPFPSTLKAVRGIPPGLMGPGDINAVTVWETDDESYMRKVTGFKPEFSGSLSLPLPQKLDASVSKANGDYQFNFAAPPQFGVPFQGFVGALVPLGLQGNATLATYTSQYLQLKGQSGPTFQVPYASAASAGAPPGSALGMDNAAIGFALWSEDTLSDGLQPRPLPGTFHLQSAFLIPWVW